MPVPTTYFRNGDETVLSGDADGRKPATRINLGNDAATAASPEMQMRILSFIAAFAVFLIGPSFAGMPDGNVPGIGTFSYQGSPVITDAPATLIMAAR